ncbi:MAG: CHAP domain-containing protein [Saprospiraceae bacterium]
MGESIDDLEGVKVFYNGSISHIENRNVSKDGYNLGLRWQCVEFVKRFYLDFFNHKMPDSYGHAKDFFDENVKDGKLNEARKLIQHSNPSLVKPKIYDILIFGKTSSNAFGHIAIISKVSDDEIEIIQQNMGYFGKSRERIKLVFDFDRWSLKDPKVLGRLTLRH